MVKKHPPASNEGVETVLRRGFTPSKVRGSSSNKESTKKAAVDIKRHATPGKKSTKTKADSAAPAPKPAADVVPPELARTISPPRPEGYEQRDASGTAEPTRARSVSPTKKTKKTTKASIATGNATKTLSPRRSITRRFSPNKKKAIDLSATPVSKQSSTNPGRIRQSRRDRTSLETALDHVQAKRATYESRVKQAEDLDKLEQEEQSTDSSLVSDESSVIDKLNEAKARYDRMLAEKRRRKAKQIKKLRKSTTTKRDDLVSLHSEHRVENVEAPITMSPKKKKKSKGKEVAVDDPEVEEFRVEIKNDEEESNKNDIFRSDKPAPAKDAKDVVDDESAASSSIEVIATSAEAAAAAAAVNKAATDDDKSEDSPVEKDFSSPVKKSHRVPEEANAGKKALASNIFHLATKSVDTEVTPSGAVQIKLEEYEAKLQALEKFLNANRASGNDGAVEQAKAEADEADKVEEDTPLENGEDVDVEEEEEEESEDEFDDIEAMPTEDISYDEDAAARLLLEDEKEDRNEEQAKTAADAEREAAEAGCFQPDFSNFCVWMFSTDKSGGTGVKRSLSIPEEDEVELSPEELTANLARRMAMDAILPKKKISKTKSLRSDHVDDDDDDISVYGRVEASAFVSRDVRMERAARRAIAAKVLTEKLLAGYSTIEAEEETCSCKKCGNQFLLNEAGTKECVVCPIIKSDLTRVTKRMVLEDPQHQVKRSLEAELRSLRKRAIVKERIAKDYVEAEGAALRSKREAEQAHERAQQAATDAEIELLWKTKELRQIRDKSRAASQKARASIEEAMKDKAEAKRKAKLGVRTAENSCIEADYQHLFAVKETALAELKIFIADEAVRQAIEVRNAAVADFQDMKRCTAKLKSESDTKQVEKAWAVAGASMLLSRKETGIKTRQAMREEAELKAVELANNIALEKEEAERQVEKTREALAKAEDGVSEAEKSYLISHKEREVVESDANEARCKADGKAAALEQALTEFNSQITQERSELKSSLGKSRTDAMELATWDEQARQIFESGDIDDEEKKEEETEEKEEESNVILDGEEKVITTDEGVPIVTEDDDTAESPDIEYTPSIETVILSESEEAEEEVDPSLAKESWNFYREVCSLIGNRWKYEEAFRHLQMDPLYPYLNFCTEVNCEGLNKAIMHKSEAAYKEMTAVEIAFDLQRKAEVAQPHLVGLCKSLAKSLKISKMGVGPVKELERAIEKAEKRYDGNLLQVTDFCRAFVVVQDIATLLALFEMVHKTMADRVCRIKFATLKKEGQALPGGYRDCKINLLVMGHVCEVQVHLLPLWSVCTVQGYGHYQKSVEYSIDNIKDPYRSLKSISDKTLSQLVDVGTDALRGTTLDILDLRDEKQLLNYFALAGIYLRLNQAAKAEAILVRLATLRSRTPAVGPLHSETLYLKKNLEASLRAQELIEEADVIAEQLAEVERRHKAEADDATATLWEFLLTDDVLAKPNMDEEEYELDEKEEKEMIASKNHWIHSRDKLFKNLQGFKRADAALSLLNNQ